MGQKNPNQNEKSIFSIKILRFDEEKKVNHAQINLMNNQITVICENLSFNTKYES